MGVGQHAVPVRALALWLSVLVTASAVAVVASWCTLACKHAVMAAACRFWLVLELSHLLEAQYLWSEAQVPRVARALVLVEASVCAVVAAPAAHQVGHWSSALPILLQREMCHCTAAMLLVRCLVRCL